MSDEEHAAVANTLFRMFSVHYVVMPWRGSANTRFAIFKFAENHGEPYRHDRPSWCLSDEVNLKRITDLLIAEKKFGETK